MTEVAGVGHNTQASGELRAFADRIARLEAEKKILSEDIKDIYTEVKSRGFDTKTLRKAIALRQRDAAEVRAEREMLDLYTHALGLDLI
jgi:uncharacterized protein (UPF0335 family)